MRLQRYRGRRRGPLRLRAWRGGERAIQHRRRDSCPRGHQLQDEREAEKDAARPPARLREPIAGLAHADKRFGRGSSAAESRRYTATLPGLQEDHEGEHESIDYQKNKKEGVHVELL